jgi:GntR family transcriptional regulator
MIVMSLEDRSGRIRHDSSVSVATQVARDIEADITAGRLAPDTRLPSEPELSQQYGVARMTVRRAVAQLRDKGLVVTIHGRGSWVAPDDELDAPRTARSGQPGLIATRDDLISSRSREPPSRCAKH